MLPVRRTTRSSVSLSPRQAEVARLLCDGLTQDQVAHRLGLATRTVEAHVGLQRAKTGRESTLAAVVNLVLGQA